MRRPPLLPSGIALPASLACALLLAAPAPSAADAPQPRPAWAATARVGDAEVPVEHPVRYTFVLPKRHPFCLVEVPAALDDGGYAARFGVRAGEHWLRHRIVRSAPDGATLLIDGSPSTGDDTVVEIYLLGRADEPPAPDADDDKAVRAPKPLSCEFRQTRFPTETSDEDVLFGVEVAMLRRANGDRALVSDIEQVAKRAAEPPPQGKGKKRRNGQGDLLADIRTMLLVEEPGTYLFALKSPGAAAILLGRDEDVVARSFQRFPALIRGDKPAEMPAGWTLGREIELTPGVLPLHIASLTPFRANGGVEVGWLRPGATDIEPIPSKSFLSAQADLPVVRTERRDGALHVAFRTRLSPPYRFASTNVAFQLLTAAPRADLWVPAPEDTPPRQDWLIDGQPVDSAHDWRATLLAPLPAGPHEIVLRATFGAESVVSTQTVVVAGTPGQEYRIAASPNGVAPVLREDDILRPDLWITGDAVGVQVELRVLQRDGSVRPVSGSVTPELQWARLEAPPLPVREAAGLAWTVRHGGVVLDEGSLDLVRPPFRELPASVAGTTLRAADGRIVSFVLPAVGDVVATPAGADLRAARKPGIARLSDLLPPAVGNALANPAGADLRAPRTAAIVWLTDLLLPEGADGALRAAFGDGFVPLRHAALRRDEGEGLSTVAPLCGLDTVPEGATVVVAVALEDWLGRRTPEQFERSLGVLAGLLHDARGARVIVCTPPPFHGDAAALRPYAAAALRAAATSGVEAADLFSGFLNAPDSAALVDGIRLTDAGVKRAADIIERIHVASGMTRGPRHAEDDSLP